MSLAKLIAAGLFGTTVILHAADDPKGPAGAESGVATTRRELQALKVESNNPVSAPILSLGNAADAPVLPPSASPMPPVPAKPSRPGAAPETDSRQPSANWLVEGVAREEAKAAATKAAKTGKTAPRDGDRLDSDAQKGDPDAMLKADSFVTDDPKKSVPVQPVSQGGAAPNPMSEYMKSWLSPADYAIFGAGITAGSGVSGGGGPIPGENPASPVGRILGTPSAGGNEILPRVPANNPFLQSPQPSPSYAPPPAIVVSPAPVKPPAPAPVVEPRQQVPEALQKDDNSKYFPQLKRF